MRDLVFFRADGSHVLVSDLTDAEITDTLAGGVEVGNASTTVLAAVERLRIEQTIRSLGLNA